MSYTATYSPDDNKLRLYAMGRLPADLYARVRGAGFIWAPKQELFVAPAWTPDREDLLLELAGDIGDEDTSLIDRAEERSERFEDYHENRTNDAEAARRAVSAIADNIPLGQPILVGHHSERHARKDAERIENGMRRAIKMWETAQYWKGRAAGAIAHAKYKERPDVRARRIKTIEADKRRRERSKADADRIVRIFSHVDQPEKWKAREDGSTLTREERAYYLAGRLSGGPYMATVHRDQGSTLRYSAYDVLAPDDKRYKDCPAMSVDEVIAKLATWRDEVHAWEDRWIAHYDNRLEYERAMLADGGGLITDRTEYPIVAGGRVQVRGEWLTVTKVNRKDGQICSVTTNSRYVRVKSIEEIKDYQPPTTEDLIATKAATKLPPLINRDSPDAMRITLAEWKQTHDDYKTTRVVKGTEEYGAYRYRVKMRGGSSLPVFLTDQKVHDLPAPTGPRPTLQPPERIIAPRTYVAPEPTEFDAMRESLRAGVKVVSAPQLFPTPDAIADRMAEYADLFPLAEVLEPSAGTGQLAMAVLRAEPGIRLFMVEINHTLAEGLSTRFSWADNRPDKVEGTCRNVLQGDFLECNGNLGTFDRIVMNPPFQNGDDIKHIEHAYRMLKVGGRLVAICANGPRQQAAFAKWSIEPTEELEAGSFAGTGVRAAIIVRDKP